MKFVAILSSTFLACSLHAQTVKDLQAELMVLQTEISALQTSAAKIATLQNQVAALQATVTKNQTVATGQYVQVNDLQLASSNQQAQLTMIENNPALLLGPFVTVDPSPENGVAGPNIVITGANVRIVNGSGQTSVVNGTGNLIIGYNELPPNIVLPNGARAGSHNFVIGRYNQFAVSGFGNLVAGELNSASGTGGFVTGYLNTIYGPNCSVLGGEGNVSGADYAVVVGGENNSVGGTANVILGGLSNSEAGEFSVLLGGTNNPPASLYGAVQQ
jgi:hypothetical protein